MTINEPMKKLLLFRPLIMKPPQETVKVQLAIEDDCRPSLPFFFLFCFAELPVFPISQAKKSHLLQQWSARIIDFNANLRDILGCHWDDRRLGIKSPPRSDRGGPGRGPSSHPSLGREHPGNEARRLQLLCPLLQRSRAGDQQRGMERSGGHHLQHFQRCTGECDLLWKRRRRKKRFPEATKRELKFFVAKRCRRLRLEISPQSLPAGGEGGLTVKKRELKLCMHRSGKLRIIISFYFISFFLSDRFFVGFNESCWVLAINANVL